MPGILDWVLGGNEGAVKGDRVLRCSMDERPRGFTESQFKQFMVDDDSLLAAAKSQLRLQPEAGAAQPAPITVGRGATLDLTAEGLPVRSPESPQASASGHVRLEDSGGIWHVTDLGTSPQGTTWVSPPARPGIPLAWRRLTAGERARIRSGDHLVVGGDPRGTSSGETGEVSMAGRGGRAFRVKSTNLVAAEGAKHAEAVAAAPR